MAKRAGYSFVRQHEVVVNGRRSFIDWADPAILTGVELDGLGKLRTKHGKRTFLERATQLQVAGWWLLHFGWHDVKERPDDVLETLAAAGLGQCRR